MDEEIREVIVDTYAIISDFSGNIPSHAFKIMENIRIGNIKGIIHHGIVYELVLLWLRGKLPFKNLDEISLFIEGYFTYHTLDIKHGYLTAKIKKKADSILANSNDPALRRRRLSYSDACSITLAIKKNVPIISGDSDLLYVAKKLGVKIIW